MFAPKVVIAAILLSASIEVNAATGCDEWASMVQVLVVRWQKDDQFEGKTNVDIKQELMRTMKNHPEIETAQRYVDYAYEHRKADYQDIWKVTYDLCSATAI